MLLVEFGFQTVGHHDIVYQQFYEEAMDIDFDLVNTAGWICYHYRLS